MEIRIWLADSEQADLTFEQAHNIAANMISGSAWNFEFEVVETP